MKKAIIIFLSVLALLTIILGIKYIVLKRTNEIPYCNLTRFGTDFYYIYCDISYKGTRNTIVCSNSKLNDLFSREKNISFVPFYSLWLTEVIKHNWCIKVNDQMFSELQFDILKKEFVQKHEKNNTKDVIIALNGELPDSLSIDDYKAIIYILLKNGINCQNNCETGDIEVIMPTNR